MHTTHYKKIVCALFLFTWLPIHCSFSVSRLLRKFGARTAFFTSSWELVVTSVLHVSAIFLLIIKRKEKLRFVIHHFSHHSKTDNKHILKVRCRAAIYEINIEPRCWVLQTKKKVFFPKICVNNRRNFFEESFWI